MRLIILGTGPFAVPMMQALIASDHEIVQVICKPPRGRRKAPPAPVALAAEQAGLPLWTPESANEPESQARLAELAADLLVVCDYGEILKRETLATTRLGGVNLHGSLLPKYRGAAPVQWAVLNGDAESGVTVIHMTPTLDAGPILGQAATPIEPDETSGELESRLAELGAPLTLEVVDKLAAGTAGPLPQDDSLRCRAPRLSKELGQIDWSKPAQEIKNLVRGAHPWPRAYTFWGSGRGEPLRLVIDRVEVLPEAGPAPAGAVVNADGRLVVAAGEGAIEILQLQPAGKRAMATADWLRGAAIKAGDGLGGGPKS
ncbi:Methionyl-tRNA formyltransferase [Posidoniimonas polymericola]|uniref:Methionyl-tRNA formyltransferase n=1 Tax=Posidoniimonas polymericola TaxID=2528002 RepID=A0A5C5ZGT2_9BACT|nr:methionyl-tRNA formyltransferase [Posidoniimonas polymericola]TWT85763.1 Methionyl-tRNA formyltransferase [Posidoniimonas polymericola]